MRSRRLTCAPGRPRNERGAAALEFALIAPLFILLMFGLLQFGWYLWTAEYTNSAARETARRVVVGDCWDGYAAFSASHGVRITSTTLNADPDNLEVGEPLEVVVTANANLGVDFFGLGLPTSVQRTYEARMEVDAQSAPAVDSCSP